jgi:acetate kinase
MAPLILTLNGGSSSIKFAVFEQGDVALERVLAGQIERIGLPDAQLTLSRPATGQSERRPIAAPDQRAAIEPLTQLLEQEVRFSEVIGAGHRVVHGARRHTRSEVITPALLADLKQFGPYDPEHLPAEIDLIEAMQARLPRLPQVACFDTAFHRDLPSVARILSLPRRFYDMGVQRYGFHGLSYSYLLDELRRVAGDEAANGRLILAHLGNGASMAAVRGGKSLDTTMAATPASGIVMSSRAGDLDPGLVSFLELAAGVTPEQFRHMVNYESGLRGVSDTTSDMRDLLAHEAEDPRAADAVALFCYTAKKQIGAYAAALGGLDTLVFAGGIGEHAPPVRARICAGLEFLGLSLDEAANAANAAVISTPASRVAVRVMKTDEEIQIARLVAATLKANA